MTEMTDLMQTADGDIALTDDLALTEATEQHKRDLLLAAQGDYKESPTLGVDCTSFLHDTDPGELLRSVRKQCERDGMRVEAVELTARGELLIDAEYELY